MIYEYGGAAGGSASQVEKDFVFGVNLPAGEPVGMESDGKVYPYIKSLAGSFGSDITAAGVEVCALTKNLLIAARYKGVQLILTAIDMSLPGAPVIGVDTEIPINADGGVYSYSIAAINPTQFVVAIAYLASSQKNNSVIVGSVSGTDITLGANSVFSLPGVMPYTPTIAVCGIDNSHFAVAYNHNNVANTLVMNIRVCSTDAQNGVAIGTALVIDTITARSPRWIAPAGIAADGKFKLVVGNIYPSNLYPYFLGLTVQNTSPYDISAWSSEIQMSSTNHWDYYNRFCGSMAGSGVAAVWVGASNATSTLKTYTLSDAGALAEQYALNITTPYLDKGALLYAGNGYVLLRTDSPLYNSNREAAIALYSTSPSITKLSSKFISNNISLPPICAVVDGVAAYFFEVVQNYLAYGSGIYYGSASAGNLSTPHSVSEPIGFTKESGLTGETHKVVLKGIVTANPKNYYYLPQVIEGYPAGSYSFMDKIPVSILTPDDIEHSRKASTHMISIYALFKQIAKPASSTEVLVL